MRGFGLILLLSVQEFEKIKSVLCRNLDKSSECCWNNDEKSVSEEVVEWDLDPSFVDRWSRESRCGLDFLCSKCGMYPAVFQMWYVSSSVPEFTTCVRVPV